MGGPGRTGSSVRRPFLLLLTLVACGGEKTDVAAERSVALSAVTLDSATALRAQLQNPVISTGHKADETLTTIIVRHDSAGFAGVPFLTGAFAYLRLTKFEAAGVEFMADSVSIRGRMYRLNAAVAPIKPIESVTGALLLDRATNLTITLRTPLTLIPPEN